MNAHSEWIKWRDKYRVPELEVPDSPRAITLDWKGIGMEGAFKAGYMIQTQLRQDADQARLIRAERQLSVARRRINELHDLLGCG